MSIGKRIKQHRKSIGLTQEDLAGPNLSTAMISLIERDMTNPSLKSLEYIAKKLNISVNYLLDEDKNEMTYSEYAQNTISLLKGLLNSEKFEEAEKVFSNIDENKIEYTYKGTLLKLKGELFLEKKMYQQAIDEFKMALIYFTPYDIEEYVGVYCKISTCYKLLDKYQFSIENALYGLILLKSNYSDNYPLLKLTLFFNLSFSYCRISEFSKGLEVLNEALDLINKSKFSYNEGLFYMLKGLSHLYLKEYDEGIKANNKAISILDQENDKQYLIGSLTNLGIIYRELQNYQLSIENIKKSLNLSKENNLEWHELNSYYELATSYVLNNNLEIAEEICKKQIGNSNILDPLKIKMLLLLAYIKFRLKLYEESLNYANDAEVQILGINDNLLLAKTYTLKSKILSAQGFINEAYELLNQAVQIYKNESHDGPNFI
ncbi:helix-turn-helix domain-containing protein [Bacillus sp. S10(2024)]|uniref:helix-turn-helix domain-containing protein n=1 Tax=Bacillus sp. S10(2024) TaxID=3162886 RepID=UPI003D22EB81